MDITRLRTLRELAQRGTMSAVAETLFLTPSAVSQQIAQLEEEAGVQLIERQGRGVRLTPAGTLLVSHADRLFTVLGEARSDMAALRKEVSGSLTIAVFPTAGTSLLPAAIHQVQEQHPYLQVVVQEMEPAEGLAALHSHRCDLAFVDDLTIGHSAKKGALEMVPLIDDTLFALLPDTHPLADKGALSVGDLREERWALDSAGSSFAEYVKSLCRRAGYEPDVNANCRGYEILAAMVAEGCSVSIVAGLRLRYPTPGVVAVPLSPEVKRRISAAYRSGEGAHPAIRAFLAALNHSVQRHQTCLSDATSNTARGESRHGSTRQRS